MNRDARNALIRAHQSNINRYCRILATHLTDYERDYVHRRIVEERLELERLLKASASHTAEIATTRPARMTRGRYPQTRPAAELSALYRGVHKTRRTSESARSGAIALREQAS
jgi:hypothetical protein